MAVVQLIIVAVVSIVPERRTSPGRIGELDVCVVAIAVWWVEIVDCHDVRELRVEWKRCVVIRKRESRRQIADLVAVVVVDIEIHVAA